MQFVLKSFKSQIKIKRLANIHYFEFTPNYHTLNDTHDFCELVYVDKGCVHISSDCFTGDMEQNQMIVHGANHNHSLTCLQKDAPNIIIIGFECEDEALLKLCHRPLSLTEELQKMLAEIIREARTVYLPPYDLPNLKNMKKRKNFSFGADQLIKNYLQIFFIKCIRLAESSQEGKLNGKTPLLKPYTNSMPHQVKAYLEENFCQKITLSELCFLFNTNKTSLSKEFKENFNYTVLEYLNLLRIEQVKKQLREGNQTLTQIAYQMNFSSVHYLTLLFKKHTQMTPTEYVRTVKKKLDIE